MAALTSLFNCSPGEQKMALKKSEKTIDGHSVSTVAFPGREGFKIKAKLFRLIGPALSSIGEITPDIKGLLNKEISAGMVGAMVGKLLENVDADDTLAFVFRLLQFTEVDNRPAFNEQVFDEIFSHNFKFLYKILFFVLEANYGDFFGAGGISSMFKSPEAMPPATGKTKK